jgi:hypothetical protein
MLHFNTSTDKVTNFLLFNCFLFPSTHILFKFYRASIIPQFNCTFTKKNYSRFASKPQMTADWLFWRLQMSSLFLKLYAVVFSALVVYMYLSSISLSARIHCCLC